MENNNQFSFEISLSVLNHLGRNLYRSFVTVLGEAISNAWDADAKNVRIYIDREKNSFYIKDDGHGMMAYDFQNKFLKIGYSKRKEGSISPIEGRPYIGRKGIGKLALLSCAEKITVVSKTKGGEYVGGVIDNRGLDEAITDDLTPEEYTLGVWDPSVFHDQIEKHEHGTIIYFENIKDGIKNSIDFLKKTIALYFRFSILDKDFSIYIDDQLIGDDCLKDLAEKTEFWWTINDHSDSYVEMLENNFNEDKNERRKIVSSENFKGFVASVEKPRDLKVVTTEERITIDLFVNGRLRERDILKHMPTSRVAENYLYGQIHYNELDDEVDRFTSSRESIVADDAKYKNMLEKFKKDVINKVIEDWDEWRRKHRKDGDPENEKIPKKERKAEELYNEVSKEYELPEGAEKKKVVDEWVKSLGSDAKYNFASYAECFVSENLIRKYIEENEIELSPEAQRDIDEFKRREEQNKISGNINIELRKNNTDLSYLDMAGLANLVDKSGSQNSLANDAKSYRPIRDSLMHTALLTDEAKRKLTTVFDNIKARIKALLLNFPF